MSTTAIDALIKKRGIIKAQLTRFANYLSKLTTSAELTKDDRALLQTKVAKLDNTFADFRQIQYEIGVLVSDVEAHECESEDFEEKFFQAQVAAKHMLEIPVKLINDTNPVNVPQNSLTAPKISKPTISLPTFDGAFDEWYHFRDMFKTMIHSDSSLSNVEKLHYLNSCLKGEAAATLNTISIAEGNYELAWDLLNERFENKQMIVHSHIKALFNINSIKRESYKALRELLDGVRWHLKALENLDLHVKEWDAIIIYLICTKLDSATKREWDAATSDNVNQLPTLNDLISLLNKRCRLLGKSSSTSENQSVNKTKINSFVSTSKPSCHYCDQSHFISQCEGLLKLGASERIAVIKRKHLCLNCLGKGHGIASCKSKFTCKRCHKKHHSLLHIEENVSVQDTPDISMPSSSKTMVTHVSARAEVSQVLLSTVCIRVADSLGGWHACRALLDSGSQSNFITTELFRKLNLPSVPINSTVLGINQASVILKQKTDIRIRARASTFEATVDCLIMDKITEPLPALSFSKSFLDIPSNITLADPTFNKEGKIDMLLGASIFGHLLCVGQIKLGERHPLLQKTRLGWVLLGPLPYEIPRVNVKVSCHVSVNLQDQLEKFWAIEECDAKREISIAEQECERHFACTTTRDDTGRFTVSIPFTSNVNDLGESRDIALRRFFATERRLNQNTELKRDYVEFLAEYERLGHMKLVDDTKRIPVDQNYYLPHHAVIKATSTTTKTRVVFDASAKTTTGISLNDIQRVGPVIQDDIFKILLRFRQHAFVVTADIEKMYRQILISEGDRKYHRIFWRAHASEDLKCYELQTITYGTASASFLATRCIQQIAIEHSSRYPEACKIIKDDFYVDDLLTGANSMEELNRLRCEVASILRSAGFHLRKWLSNGAIESQDTTEEGNLSLANDGEARTLGITWNPNIDAFKYEISISNSTRHATKRTILATTAKIFDPIGFLGPVVVVAKLIIQKLWQCKLSWDESIPQDLHHKWTDFLEEIKSSTAINIPRLAFLANSVTIECHGFADASERAYGACVYIRCIDIAGNITVNLLCSKSRVAPLRQVTLPRLELCAAVLLADLVVRVRESLSVQFHAQYFWSDSTITLNWIKSDPSRWQIFVGNRVSKIQSHTDSQQWHHVRSQDNPADLLSRGTSLSQLANLDMWWYGPSWLSKQDNEWPIEVSVLSSSACQLPELRKTVTLTSTKIGWDLFEKFSSFSKLQRVTAWVLRFAANCRNKHADRQRGLLTTTELCQSLTTLVRVAQARAFASDIERLRAEPSQDCSSGLLALRPFLDDNGLLRVGGRIGNSHFHSDKKHPIILPKKHVLTNMIIMYEHKRLLHCGAQAVLSSLRERFWPLSARSSIKGIIRNCVICFRSNPRQTQYLMGDLPNVRITPSSVFQNCGIDYAGPFSLKNKKTRGYQTSKAYICLFICMSTKAVHLELVSSLSTEAFLASLRRFISRRGKPSNIYSDNGTNFVGAERELRELLRLAKSETIHEFSTQEGITWHFSPPRAPHFGGLWEAGIKSTKGHLKRILRNALLTFEDFCTILNQIEAVLNSRPISPLSEDPNDLNPLTPGHFLIGRPLTGLPEPSLSTIAEGRLSHFQRMQALVQHYWRRWSKEYVGELQTRCRWKRNNQALLTVGAMVVVPEDNQPPFRWKLGRILQLHPGNDGIVRVVTLRTMSNTIKRPVLKICVLPIEGN